MKAFTKTILLAASLGNVSAQAEKEQQSPVGFYHGDYQFQLNLKQHQPPKSVQKFRVPDQGYLGCIPANMTRGAYYASNYTINHAEQADIKSLRLYIQDGYDTGDLSVELIEIFTGTMKQTPQWDGSTALARYDEDVAEKSQETFDNRVKGYDYVLDFDSLSEFLSLVSSDMACVAERERFEWDTLDPLVSYPSKGWLKFYFVDGRFYATGVVQRYNSWMGLSLGSYGGYKELSFEITPLVGEKFKRPLSQ